MLRLNLILNNLSHSIPNIVRSNTIKDAVYLKEKFDYIVSNPPFKLDFSDFRSDLEKDSFKERFFAGIPNIPKKKKESMAIYLLFIQHIMYSLNDNGKAAVVVPTGFITAPSGIEKRIRQQLIEHGWLRGVVSMPSNIFSNTGTNVSVLFIDKKADNKHIVLVDSSKMGETISDNNKQCTVLRYEEEQQIVGAMNQLRALDNISVIVTSETIQGKNYSFSAGQYFEVKIKYSDITNKQFDQKISDFNKNLDILFRNSRTLEAKIKENLRDLKYDI